MSIAHRSPPSETARKAQSHPEEKGKEAGAAAVEGVTSSVEVENGHRGLGIRVYYIQKIIKFHA